MYNIEVFKGSIVNHMESMGLINSNKCVSKANIVLSVARKLDVDESREYLIEEAFNILVQEDKIRSSYSKYDTTGKWIGAVISAHEEKFYLNK